MKYKSAIDELNTMLNNFWKSQRLDILMKFEDAPLLLDPPKLLHVIYNNDVLSNSWDIYFKTQNTIWKIRKEDETLTPAYSKFIVSIIINSEVTLNGNSTVISLNEVISEGTSKNGKFTVEKSSLQFVHLFNDANLFLEFVEKLWMIVFSNKVEEINLAFMEDQIPEFENTVMGTTVIDVKTNTVQWGERITESSYLYNLINRNRRKLVAAIREIPSTVNTKV